MTTSISPDFAPDFELTEPARVVVLGAARSGLAAAEFLQQKNYAVTLSDAGSLSEEARQRLSTASIAFEEQGHTEGFLQEADFLVASPGIPLTAPPFVWAKKHGIAVVSEVELAWQFLQKMSSRPRLIAVTGSNGKSTVVTLLETLFNTAGFKAKACGNIGTPLIQCVEGGFDTLILEISSFQLETTYTLRPDGAILLNLYENHLDRHGAMDTYFEIKSRLFAHQRDADVAVLSRTNPWCKRLTARLSGRVCTFALPFAEMLMYRGKPLMPISDIALKGEHNLENVQAVKTLAAAFDVQEAALKTTLETFRGIPHRLEPLPDVRERHFINDSKSTNYLAAQKALQAMDRPVIWIAGGKDKGGDFSELAQWAHKRAKHTVLMGECAPYFAQLLIQSGYNQITQVSTMQEAVEAAVEHAQSGDTVLLSPATASYDAYANFEARGDDFKAHVDQLVSKA